ncbi:MAG: FtsX-like permease family protein, partial [Actinobacteria bacterium]|nr:FtsX-like permease family protein [Actinomycetota bacterium]
SVFERRREIGLLRAVGMTKSQVGETVAWESVVTSLVGAVTGVVLGLGLGLVIVLTSGDELIGFTVPVGGTVAILVLSFVLGIVASFYPAWRATRVNVVEAIATT